MPNTGSATQTTPLHDPTPFSHVAVIGGGAWGTALALTAHRAGRSTSLWIREESAAAEIGSTGRNPFLPGHEIPRAIAVTTALDAALRGAGLAVLVIPSQHLRAVAARVEALLPPGVPVVVCSKGVEAGSGALMTQVVAEEMPGRPQAVLSGPSFAAEVAEDQPTAVTIAAAGPGGPQDLFAEDHLAGRVAVTFASETFRPYLSDDPVGVEVSGAVKNVLAVASGIIAGRGMGSNPRAALLARGLAEISRLSVALGGRAETVLGLSGAGDVMLTCSSEQSRNFSFGKALGAGRAPGAAQGAIGRAVVEGVANARSVLALAQRLGVQMPICEAVDRIVHRGLPVERAIAALLTGPLRAEPRALEHRASIAHPALSAPQARRVFA
ncbi:glycerol-3-phosphate dehydrogenase [Pseudoroseomonas rhizosphaerae]|uniref:Glycerol-3-phosphate dehydrogenase [NAD(P)+] n=1 Tax=Teichococcus rhizosphaerae TaxID=1335062 RepID=A0A2C7AB01_9PROT|nr:NAD(P)H-dependent glycerol-3-phosphate dehydrogenase [Pseudoroseomonas rhizosphaerae]PHK94266.1 glycerol-3-phosphate dehydrogenase [Pseudoroseomonas rhizosphaerae]